MATVAEVPASGAVAPVRLERAQHKADSYYTRRAGHLYTAELDYTRGDSCGLYVVRESGREIGAVRSVPRARDLVERHLARIVAFLNAEIPE